MLSPKLKQQVSALWDMFWSGGMTNPLTSIEQITYLIFLKRLETLDAERRAAGKPSIYGRRPDCELEHHDLDNPVVDTLPPNADPAQYEKCKGHSTCRWSYLRYLSTSGGSEGQRIVTPYDHMNSYVFPWLRVLHKTLAAVNHTANGERCWMRRWTMRFFSSPKRKRPCSRRLLRWWITSLRIWVMPVRMISWATFSSICSVKFRPRARMDSSVHHATLSAS